MENTTYINHDLTDEFTTTYVVRDNCRSPELFCGAATKLCELTRVTGSACQTDGECKTVILITASWFRNPGLTALDVAQL